MDQSFCQDDGVMSEKSAKKDHLKLKRVLSEDGKDLIAGDAVVSTVTLPKLNNQHHSNSSSVQSFSDQHSVGTSEFGIRKVPIEQPLPSGLISASPVKATVGSLLLKANECPEFNVNSFPAYPKKTEENKPRGGTIKELMLRNVEEKMNDTNSYTNYSSSPIAKHPKKRRLLTDDYQATTSCMTSVTSESITSSSYLLNVQQNNHTKYSVSPTVQSPNIQSPYTCQDSKCVSVSSNLNTFSSVPFPSFPPSLVTSDQLHYYIPSIGLQSSLLAQVHQQRSVFSDLSHSGQRRYGAAADLSNLTPLSTFLSPPSTLLSQEFVPEPKNSFCSRDNLYHSVISATTTGNLQEQLPVSSQVDSDLNSDRLSVSATSPTSQQQITSHSEQVGQTVFILTGNQKI